MRCRTFLAVLALLCAFTLAAKTRKSSSRSSQPVKATIHEKKAASRQKARSPLKATSTAKARRGRTRGRAKSSRRVVRGPYRQQVPTTERYAEIQQALADRGYFTGTVNGTWGADSVDALKRFEADQNLTPDGKINSLTLIALGLGPKRETAGDIASHPATEPPANP